MEGFTFQAEVNDRIHRYFHGVTDAYRDGERLSWSDSLCRWVSDEERSEVTGWISNYSRGVRTLKAFRSHVRRHGLESATLRNRFLGYDVYFSSTP